jgi:anti-anti-sigma factor
MKTEIEGNIVIIIPNKKIDGAEFIKKVMDILRDNTGKHFILDFKDTDYVSSLDVRIILDMHKRLLEKRIQLIICNLNSIIKKLFDLVSLNKIISIYRDKEHAKAYLSTLE